MVEPYRILIIEDDPEHTDLIRMSFKKHDEFFLDFASTGELGLEKIAQNSYDLISVDLVLPGIGGLDVLVKIRKFDPDMPVVMVSGRGTTDLVVVAFENRATKYVVKSLESIKSLPYIFENLIQEARFKASERKMREQIERSERIYRSLVENALAGIYILQDGMFRLANPKLAEIFGCTPASLMGTAFWQLVKPDDIECISKLECEQQVPAPVYESKVLRKDGDIRWIEFRTVPIEYEGRRAILGNLVDITARKQRELSLVAANKELAAINNILNRIIYNEVDIEEMLEKTILDIIYGIEGAETGGIFLKEKEGLVLRALAGSVEDLISFINAIDSSHLMKRPGLYKCEESRYEWTFAPIVSGGIALGVLIVAVDMGDGNRALGFLEKAANHIGSIMDNNSMRIPLQNGSEPLLKQVKIN